MLLALPPLSLWVPSDISMLEVYAGSAARLKPYPVSDTFGVATQQDYLAGGNGPKAFGWNLAGDIYSTPVDANITSAGDLAFNIAALGWNPTVYYYPGFYFNPYTANYLYRWVTGDFDIDMAVDFNSFTGNFQMYALLLQDVSAGQSAFMAYSMTGKGQGWVQIDPDGTQHEGGASSGPYPFTRMTRVGNVFNIYRKNNAADPWVLHNNIPFTLNYAARVRVGIVAQGQMFTPAFPARVHAFNVTFGAMEGCYSSSSPVLESSPIAVPSNTLNGIALSENLLGGTGSLMYQYALNNGAYNGVWLTLAALNTAVSGQAITDHVNSLRLKAQFNSNNYQQAELVIADKLDVADVPKAGSGGRSQIGGKSEVFGG